MKLARLGFAIVAFLFVLVPQAQAWRVTVYNATQSRNLVVLYAINLDKVAFEFSQQMLEGKGVCFHQSACDRYTFDTGWYCPSALLGYGAPGLDIAHTCLGPLRELLKNTSYCWANCFNSEWTLVQYADGSVHFKKGNHTAVKEDKEDKDEKEDDEFDDRFYHPF
jgi:hypothetical protein